MGKESVLVKNNIVSNSVKNYDLLIDESFQKKTQEKVLMSSLKKLTSLKTAWDYLVANHSDLIKEMTAYNYYRKVLAWFGKGFILSAVMFFMATWLDKYFLSTLSFVFNFFFCIFFSSGLIFNLLEDEYNDFLGVKTRYDYPDFVKDVGRLYQKEKRFTFVLKKRFNLIYKNILLIEEQLKGKVPGVDIVSLIQDKLMDGYQKGLTIIEVLKTIPQKSIELAAFSLMKF